MASSSWVIRLEADNGETPILVKVSRKEGGHDLDVDLLATDGDAAYTGKVRQRSLKRLRAKNYDGSDDDWAAILSYVLRTKTGRPINAAQKQSLDVTCSLSGKDPNRTLAITFRNKVENITQKLGGIELRQTEDTDDIDLFGWTLQVIEKRDELDETVEALTGALGEKDSALKALQKQIDEIVGAKAEHEKQLLSKFTVLLNEKKLKIRTMQRVLSSAKADPKKVEEIQAVIKEEDSASAARKNKRQAEEHPHQDDGTDDSEAFETMDVDVGARVRNQVPSERDSPSSRETTPARTETDQDEADDLSHPQPTTERRRTRAMDSQKNSKGKSPSPLPPHRELPFQKKATRQDHSKAEAQKVQSAQDSHLEQDDEETASEDDEL